MKKLVIVILFLFLSRGVFAIHEADTDLDNCVKQIELTNYALKWHLGNATLENLMEAIVLWVDDIGCYCGNKVCDIAENELTCPSDCIFGNINLSYTQYFLNNPNVKNSFDINIGDSLKDFWGYIYALEENGTINIDEPSQLADCTEPEICLFIPLNTSEMQKILAAKIAHSIWLDKNNLVYWKLNQYDQNELNSLFNKDILFLKNNTNYYYYSLVDYSPSEVYNYSKQFLDNDPKNTSYLIIDDLRKDFTHGISTRHPTSTSYSLKEALTQFDMNNQRVSRTGCQSMSDIVIGLLRSLNIPSYEDWGWYSGSGHSSTFMNSIEKILIHGDDIYNRALSVTPVDKLLMDNSYFNSYVYPCGKFTNCSSYWTGRFEALNVITYISNAIKLCCCNLNCDCNDGICNTCEEYFNDHYSDVLTPTEIQNAVSNTLSMCAN